MSQFFGKVKTKLDLNGPSLEFSAQPVSVATTGVGIGSTGGPNVTLSGIATVGFINAPESPPPCIAVIDEDSGGNANADWANFYESSPYRQFNLMDVAGGGSVGIPTYTSPGFQNFHAYNVNRDEGVVANRSDWFDIVGLSTLTGTTIVSLWVDSSGSMVPADVQASLDLFLSKCSNAGLTVEQAGNPDSYGENYIQPFITELVGPPAPVNKGSVGYQWYESSLGKLVEGDKYVGTATTSLTIKNIITPTDDNTKYYLEADYIPGQPGAKTGNATNEPFNSGIATVTVTPIIDIISQPSTTAAPQNTNITFSISAQLTNNTTGGISYQWQLDGEDIDDGDISYNSATSTTYSRQFFDQESFTLPTDSTNITLENAGCPGGDGNEGDIPDDYGTAGEGGSGRTAMFNFPDSNGASNTLKFYQGKRGQDGIYGTGVADPRGESGGIGGAGAGSNSYGGNSGGGPPVWGGGGGGASGFTLNEVSPYITANGDDAWIAIAGGGGGGGAAGNDGGAGSAGANGGDGNEIGGNVKTWYPVTAVNTYPGFNGSASPTSPSGYGSGGGGGSSVYGGNPAQTGGNGGISTPTAGEGGTQGNSTYKDGIGMSIFSSSHNPSYTGADGWGSVTYTSSQAAGAPPPQNITVSGTKTNTLTIKADAVLTRRLRCVVSHTSEDIADITSEEVNFICQSTTGTNNLNIEVISNTSTATLLDHDLSNGAYTFDMVESSSTSTVLYYILYSPDKDIDVEMDLYGGKGSDMGANNGGQGGYSRIRFKMQQNIEYTISGLNEVINAPFVYRQAHLIACAGEGGHAGNGAHGGNGGGVNVGGDSGWGLEGGQPGGEVVTSGNLTGDGIFGSNWIQPWNDLYPADIQADENNGGRTISCPKGVYWALRAAPQCADIGDQQFRLADGTVVTNSSTLIDRGYKAGYDIIQTAGAALSTAAGRGGNGATGGIGGTGNNALGQGGGGGSGYTDGSVTVVDTQQGGSNGNSKVVIRLVVSE